MDKLQEHKFSQEIKNSFLDYAMSVIVSRALPDVRDGLKPVQRRIIYGMNAMGVNATVPHKKCARITGEVMGKYHPHGDSSIYEALVRMAQDFSYRYTLVDGHGNFGSIDGDGAAAQRYTEARMSKVSMELVRDMNKDTVNFVPNYDGEEQEPEVLPARFPNILVNGTTGIAVGMATNMPPHNLGEVIDGCIALIDNSKIDTLELMNYIKGPDFPTGGIILGNSAIKQAYDTGRGIITIRSRAEIEEMPNGKHQIIITEIPYMVNKSVLITKIADLVKEKIIDGITDLRDESSSRAGIRIVIELRRDANANVILNNLYKHTALQSTYGINNLALVDGQPLILPLKTILEKYLDHQKVVIIRRTKYDLMKAQERAHILEGLKIALDNIDAVIQLIKKAKNDEEATSGLINNFKLSEIQAKAILEMKLRRLTGLERNKIEAELAELLKLIEKYKEILDSEELVKQIIKDEMLEIKQKFGDDRRTHIDLTAIDYIEDESLIPVDSVIVSLTNKGYVKRVLVDTYHAQNRGGVGIKGMATNEEDFVELLITCTTHDYLLFFSNRGKVYRIKCYEIPEFSRQSKGLPIINILPLEKGESINSIISISNHEDKLESLMFFTKKGLVKRTELSEFDLIRTNGKIAISLKEYDELISVKKTNGNNEVIMTSNAGRMVRFNENEVRLMGRNACGVKGIQMDNESVIGAEVVNDNEMILVVTENGYGKKTDVNEYRLTHRGSKGVRALNITEKNGLIVAFKSVVGNEDVIIMTNNGIIIRIDVNKVSTLKRNTQGVKLMSLKEGQIVTTVAVTEKSDNSEETTPILKNEEGN